MNRVRRDHLLITGKVPRVEPPFPMWLYAPAFFIFIICLVIWLRFQFGASDPWIPKRLSFSTLCPYWQASEPRACRYV